MQFLLNNSKKKIIFFFLISSVLVFCSSPILNTGDAGELITASYGLGIAHPPGYPLYILLGKIFTLIPVGNIASRLSFMSCFFSILSLFMFYRILSFIDVQKEIIYFTLLIFCFSYSFFTQSLISKFYTLNLFIFLYIFFLLLNINRKYSEKILLKLSFLFGLGMCNHHTILFLSIPIIFVILKKSPTKIIDLLKFIFISLLILCLIYVPYVFIRSDKNTLFNFMNVKNFNDLLVLFFRINYGKGSSLNIAESVVCNDSIQRLFFSLKNIFMLTVKEFSFLSVIFFILGFIRLFKNNIFIITFIIYSFFLPYLLFSGKHISKIDYYIVGHQYFLPTFALFLISFAYGIHLIVNKLNLYKFHLFMFTFSFLPFFILPFRLIDSNYTNNWMLYYQGIDSLFSQRIGSIYIVQGDNSINRTLYLKNIENFRDDICGISPALRHDYSIQNLCPINNYSILHNDLKIFFNLKQKKYIIALPKHSYYYSNFKDVKFLKSKNKFDVIDYLFKTNTNITMNDRIKFLPFIENHHKWCFYDTTDDLFTSIMCTVYIYYYTYLAKDLEKCYKNKITINLPNKKVTVCIDKKNENFILTILKLLKISEMNFFLKQQ